MKYTERKKACFQFILMILLLIVLANCSEHKQFAHGKLYPFKQDQKWGYIDKTGSVIVSPQFEEASPIFISGYALFKNNGEYGLIDSCGNITIPANYDKLTYAYQGIVWAMKNGKWGAVDTFDKPLIPFIYDTISYNMEIQPMLIKKSGKWIYIDKQGKQVFEQDFDKADVFSGPLALVEKNGRYGYINKTGKYIIAPEYEEAESFFGEKTLVFQNGSYFIIDTTGKQKLKIPYDKAEQTNKDFIKVLNGDKWGIINTKGTLIADTIYDEIGPYFNDGYSWGWYDGNCFIISDKGKRIPLPRIDRIWEFENGIASFRKDNNYGFCDTTGKIITTNSTSDFMFSEGLSVVANADNLLGYMDTKGKLVIPYQFTNASPFKNGLACVEKNGKMAYVNTVGKIIWEEK